jgi:hypothetical protein
MAFIFPVAFAIRVAFIWFLLYMWWKFRPREPKPTAEDGLGDSGNAPMS